MSFGESVAKHLGPKTNRYAISASAALDWLNDPICPDSQNCPFIYGYATPQGEFNQVVPSDFLGIEGLLKKIRARTVVIALGTNDANQRCQMRPEESTKPLIELIHKLNGRRCFWIGPPKYTQGPIFDHCGEKYDIFVDQMKSVITTEGCKFIDSRLIKDPQTGLPIESNSGDLIHFDQRLGQYWGRLVVRRIRQN